MPLKVLSVKVQKKFLSNMHCTFNYRYRVGHSRKTDIAARGEGEKAVTIFRVPRLRPY